MCDAPGRRRGGGHVWCRVPCPGQIDRCRHPARWVGRRPALGRGCVAGHPGMRAGVHRVDGRLGSPRGLPTRGRCPATRQCTSLRASNRQGRNRPIARPQLARVARTFWRPWVFGRGGPARSPPPGDQRAAGAWRLPGRHRRCCRGHRQSTQCAHGAQAPGPAGLRPGRRAASVCVGAGRPLPHAPCGVWPRC